MDTSIFRYVLEVEKYRNITQAAKRLFISQPALTKQLNKLEKELGFSPFDRTHSPISVTPQGEIFLDFARRYVQLESEMMDSLRQFNQIPAEPVLIATTHRGGAYAAVQAAPFMMTPRIEELIDDMFDTMYEANGVGLAAPQVGIRKRLVVIDCGDDPIVLINPVVLETSGSQTGLEGCLSVPGKTGEVTRPNYAKVKALNENMEEIIVEGEELLARCLLHEIDHLDGIMYVDKVEGELLSTDDVEE